MSCQSSAIGEQRQEKTKNVIYKRFNKIYFSFF